MHKILQKIFPFDLVEIKKLNGYDNENYLVKAGGKNYIFKTYIYSAGTFDLVEAENKALLFLHDDTHKKFPQPIPFTDGSYVKIIDVKGKKSVCRMLSFIEGESMGDVATTEKLLQSFGVLLAEMDLKLTKFNNHTIQARQWEWGIEYLNLNYKLIQDIDNAKDRSTVKYFFQQFAENVAPILPELRKSTIHNDANEWNVMVSNGEV